MIDPPSSEEIINFEGPEGDTLFNRFLIWCLPMEWEAEVQNEIDEVFAHLSSEDDRAVALVGALLIENAIDQLLTAYIPGYKDLKDNRDFTLSIKIGLARSLKLCPSRLFGAADAIRSVRNDFAHNLRITTFNECEPKHLRSIEGHLLQINKKQADEKSPRELFAGLVSMVFLALRGYQFHVERLNHFIRCSESFRHLLKDYCEANYPQIT